MVVVPSFKALPFLSSHRLELQLRNVDALHFDPMSRQLRRICFISTTGSVPSAVTLWLSTSRFVCAVGANRVLQRALFVPYSGARLARFRFILAFEQPVPW